MLNSADFRVPRSESGCSLSDILIPDAPEKYFLSSEQSEKLLYKSSAGRRDRVYDPRGTACTQTAGGGGKGVKTGLYLMEPDTARSCFGCGSVYRQADTDRERQVPYRTIQPNYTLQPPRRTLWGPADKEAAKRGYKEAAIGDTVDLGMQAATHAVGVGRYRTHPETSCIRNRGGAAGASA